MDKYRFYFRIFRSFVISSFAGLIVSDILYFSVRLPVDGGEFIKIEYFGFILAVLLGVGLMLTPMPEAKNIKLEFIGKIIRSICFTLSILLTYYYYLFLMDRIYGSQAHLETTKAILIIYGALFFRLFFSFE